MMPMTPHGAGLLLGPQTAAAAALGLQQTSVHITGAVQLYGDVNDAELFYETRAQASSAAQSLQLVHPSMVYWQ